MTDSEALSELVEAAARALCELENGPMSLDELAYPGRPTWYDLHADEYRESARAALTAARVPEMQAVVEAAQQAVGWLIPANGGRVWPPNHETADRVLRAALARYGEAQQCACPESWQAVGPCSGGCGKVIADQYCQDCEITNV